MKDFSMSVRQPYTFPFLLRPFYRQAMLRGPADAVYFTFDDGPSPDVTPWVLDQLDRYDAKATFFLIGRNLEKHLSLAKETRARGHSTGNHTWHHLNARKVKSSFYYDDIMRMQKFMEKYGLNTRRLFRPPYGMIAPWQIRRLKREGFTTVLWSRLSWDFHHPHPPEKALAYLKKHIRPGDIIVFHDSPKAFASLRILLPELLEHVYQKGWPMKAL